MIFKNKFIILLIFITLLSNLTIFNTYQAMSNDENLDTFFSSYAYSNDINGYAVVTKHVNDGYDILYEGEVVNNPTKSFSNDSIFDIGSVSKLYTAVAIYIAQDQGLLSIDDPISLYLDVPIDKMNVTIAQLLSHSSGIYVDENENTHVSKEEELQRIYDSELLFTPGENYRYSNAGFTLLAAIIESASGESFEDFMKENIFDPLELTSTGFPSTEELDEEKAIVGSLDDINYGKVTDLPFSWYSKGYTDILTTPAELNYFFHSIISGDLIEGSDLNDFSSPYLDLGDGVSRTLGAEIMNYANGTYVGHTGVWYGGNTAVFYREEDQIMITVFTDDVYVGYSYPAKLLAKSFFSTYSKNSLDDVIPLEHISTTPAVEEQTYISNNELLIEDSKQDEKNIDIFSFNPIKLRIIAVLFGILLLLIFLLFKRNF